MNEMEQMAAHAQDASQLMKELSNTHRLMICCCLGDNELSVSEINDCIPLSQSALSQHLARLRTAQLVTTRKDGQTVYYRLMGDSVIKVILTLKSIFCPDPQPENS